jgi:pentatricopeptide repeat protein
MTEKPFELTDMDYGIRIELISKAQGVRKAADYFATIPEKFRTSMAYTILLTAFVDHNKEKEAIKLVQEAERLGLGHRTYMYNQLLHVYKKNGLIAGVAEVLRAMDAKNVEPDIYTYNIILDIRARKGDAHGMEKVWHRMKGDRNIVPDSATFAILAKGYLVAGMHEKAENMVRRVEAGPFRRRRLVNLMLLKLYGQLGKKDDLERVFRAIEEAQKVTIADYEAMIRSLGMVGEVDRAEDVFEEMLDKGLGKGVQQYNALLSVYAQSGRIKKGERLLKKIARASLNPNPSTYHELVLMYLKGGEERKAMEILVKAQKMGRTSARSRPLYASFHAALDWFAERGDVKNAEKMIKDLKDSGYSCAYRSYVVLLKAYERARMSPYGFIDRIRADNVIPNQFIRKELQRLQGT